MALIVRPNKYFYHFTHIENLDSIIKNGLLSTNQKKNIGIGHVDVANENIQGRRSNMDVPCYPYGKIHDYVPFYFATINPMLLSVVNRKNIDQPDVIFFALSTDKIAQRNVIFTDAAANTVQAPNFYSDPEDLGKLSWDLINISKWGSASPAITQARMAEVLIHKQMPLDWIDSIIVYNDEKKESVEMIFQENGLKAPSVEFDPFNGRNFYFTKFFVQGRENETLVTGPRLLKDDFNNVVKATLKNRVVEPPIAPSFENIEDALIKIEDDFCIIDELDGIHQLETSNPLHTQKVCDHTKEVVTNLDSISYYKRLDDEDRSIVKLAAYFHDIGKGPKSKWKDGIQPNYPDHPADSLNMMERILSEEFEDLTEYQVRLICLLVGYHDLIGDILKHGRSKKELMDLNLDGNQLNMLAALTLADVKSINRSWYLELMFQIRGLIARF